MFNFVKPSWWKPGPVHHTPSPTIPKPTSSKGEKAEARSHFVKMRPSRRKTKKHQPTTEAIPNEQAEHASETFETQSRWPSAPCQRVFVSDQKTTVVTWRAPWDPTTVVPSPLQQINCVESEAAAQHSLPVAPPTSIKRKWKAILHELRKLVPLKPSIDAFYKGGRIRNFELCELFKGLQCQHRHSDEINLSYDCGFVWETADKACHYCVAFGDSPLGYATTDEINVGYDLAEFEVGWAEAKRLAAETECDVDAVLDVFTTKGSSQEFTKLTKMNVPIPNERGGNERGDDKLSVAAEGDHAGGEAGKKLAANSTSAISVQKAVGLSAVDKRKAKKSKKKKKKASGILESDHQTQLADTTQQNHLSKCDEVGKGSETNAKVSPRAKKETGKAAILGHADVADNPPTGNKRFPAIEAQTTSEPSDRQSGPRKLKHNAVLEGKLEEAFQNNLNGHVDADHATITSDPPSKDDESCTETVDRALRGIQSCIGEISRLSVEDPSHAKSCTWKPTETPGLLDSQPNDKPRTIVDTVSKALQSGKGEWWIDQYMAILSQVDGDVHDVVEAFGRPIVTHYLGSEIVDECFRRCKSDNPSIEELSKSLSNPDIFKAVMESTLGVELFRNLDGESNTNSKLTKINKSPFSIRATVVPAKHASGIEIDQIAPPIEKRVKATADSKWKIEQDISKPDLPIRSKELTADSPMLIGDKLKDFRWGVQSDNQRKVLLDSGWPNTVIDAMPQSLVNFLVKGKVLIRDGPVDPRTGVATKEQYHTLHRHGFEDITIDNCSQSLVEVLCEAAQVREDADDVRGGLKETKEESTLSNVRSQASTNAIGTANLQTSVSQLIEKSMMPKKDNGSAVSSCMPSGSSQTKKASATNGPRITFPESVRHITQPNLWPTASELDATSNDYATVHAEALSMFMSTEPLRGGFRPPMNYSLLWQHMMDPAKRRGTWPELTGDPPLNPNVSEGAILKWPRQIKRLRRKEQEGSSDGTDLDAKMLSKATANPGGDDVDFSELYKTCFNRANGGFQLPYWCHHVLPSKTLEKDILASEGLSTMDDGRALKFESRPVAASGVRKNDQHLSKRLKRYFSIEGEGTLPSLL